jgi:hypothetical protein
MTIFQWGVFIIIAGPLWLYIVVRLASMAWYKSKFEEEQQWQGNEGEA